MIINMRYLLIGASLNPIFSGKSLRHKFLMMHLVADENWAITIAAHRKGVTSTYYLFGGGLCLLFAWCAGTLSGHLLGTVIQNPEALALDFAFFAIFTAITISLWQGKKDALPWLAAVILAIAAAELLPGKWYIVMGGIGGALFAALPVTGKSEEPVEE